MYGWLGKIQWNIITCKRRFLQSVIYGRYCWCRLCAYKTFCQDFEIKNLGKNHDLYVQGDTILLADVFAKFRNRCLKYMNLILKDML